MDELEPAGDQQAQGSRDQPVNMSDLEPVNMSELEPAKPEAEGMFKSGARELAHSVIPAAVAMPAMALGGAGGAAVGGPIAGIAGGVVAGGAAAYGANKLQDKALSMAGIDDSAQRQANEEAHPVATWLGGALPMAATMSPGGLATKFLHRAGSGALMGAVGAAGDVAQGELPSPGKVAGDVALGFALPNANRLGQKLMAPGEAAANALGKKFKTLGPVNPTTPAPPTTPPAPSQPGTFAPGRPDQSPGPTVAAEKTAATTSASTPLTVARGTSAVMPKPVESPESTGNPQSAPVRSEQRYPKEGTPEAGTAQPELNTGVPADMRAALEAATPEAAPPTQQAPSPRPVGQENLPQDLGMPAPKPSPFEGGNPDLAGAGSARGNRPERQEAPSVQASQPTTRPGSAPIELKAPEPAQTPEAATPEDAKVNAATNKALDGAAARTNPEPTQAQKESGKYRKGVTTVDGVKVAIENPRGSVRTGEGPDGKPWSVRMPDHYGEIQGTRGADGDKVDAFVGDNGTKHFIIDQLDPATGKFDEHKVMMRYPDKASALKAYGEAYGEAPAEVAKRIGKVTELNSKQLKQWLSNKKATKEPLGEQPEVAEPIEAPPKQPGSAPIEIKAPQKKLAKQITAEANDTVAEKMAQQKALREAAKAAGKSIKDFVNDQGGAINTQAVSASLKKAGATLKKGYDWLNGGSGMLSDDYMARKYGSDADRYARSMSDQLHGVSQRAKQVKVELGKSLESTPEKMQPEKEQQDIYHAIDEGTGNMTPEQKAYYDKDLKPMADANAQLKANIDTMSPGLLGPTVKDHIFRMAKGAENDPFMRLGENADPTQSRNISTGRRGPAFERSFFALEDSAGNRKVIAPKEDGFTQFDKYKSSDKSDPNFTFQDGGTYTDPQGKVWKMGQATTKEIEAHATDKKGKPMQYYKNAAVSIHMTHAYLREVADHLQFLNDLKQDPEFHKFARPARMGHNGGPPMPSPDGWERSTMPQFHNWEMEPHLREVFDDYSKAGLEGDALSRLRRLSQAITKTIFWNPVPHIANVGEHWFVARGWDWITPNGMRSLAVDGARAVRSVAQQDHIQKEIRDNGGGTVMGGLLTKDTLEHFGNAVGMNIQRNPSKWDPIARTLGIDTKQMLKSLYDMSSKTMWAANDMLYTQAYLEARGKGMSPKEAITHVDRHIPNYRMASRIVADSAFGRSASKILGDPVAFVFGRYHQGVYNSFAHIAKDIAFGDGKRRAEAIGNLWAMGLLGTAVYGTLSYVSRKITGNEDAEKQARGPLAPIKGIADISKTGDIQANLRRAMTLSPLMAAVGAVSTNKDWAGRDILQHGDNRAAARGDVRAGARVVGQGVDWAARTAFAPYNTFAQSQAPGRSAGQTLRDQVLDIKNPSEASKKFLGGPRIDEEAKQRFKKPRGPIEGLVNKLAPR